MRKAEIEELLDEVCSTIKVIDGEYERVNQDLSVKEFMKVKIKHALEDLRSCLDYCANDIYDRFYYDSTVSKRPNIYFPYGKNQNDFLSMLGMSFKNLERKNKAVYDEIISIQSFNCTEAWLYDLCSITNTNKHLTLLGQTRKSKAELKVNDLGIIGFDGAGEGCTVVLSGCTFNGVKQNEDIIIQDGRAHISDKDRDIVFEIDTQFYISGTDIDCIKLLKDSYKGITGFVNNLYRVM